MSNAAIKIGPYLVGSDHPPFLIAEISANHNGRLETALEIVKSAAENGAHAIKLQTFTAATLSIDSDRPEFYIDDPKSLWHGRRLWDLYEDAHTPWEWHQPLFEAARERGLACISSAFDQSSLEFLIGLDVDAVKIASFELVHIPLIQAAARTGKPVVVSTGMASLEEIDDAVAALRNSGCTEFVLLKCTSAYPSEEQDTNLLTIPDMAARYGCHIGLSDHSLRPFAAYGAVGLGATMIEKHLTLRRADGGLDAAFSMEPIDLKELADGSLLVWVSRGTVTYGSQCSEQTSRKERPSIYVVEPVERGQPLTENNIRIIRPGAGLPPREYHQLIGRRAAADIHAGTPLAWELLTPIEQ